MALWLLVWLQCLPLLRTGPWPLARAKLSAPRSLTAPSQQVHPRLRLPALPPPLLLSAPRAPLLLAPRVHGSQEVLRLLLLLLLLPQRQMVVPLLPLLLPPLQMVAPLLLLLLLPPPRQMVAPWLL